MLSHHSARPAGASRRGGARERAAAQQPPLIIPVRGDGDASTFFCAGAVTVVTSFPGYRKLQLPYVGREIYEAGLVPVLGYHGMYVRA